MTPQTGTAYAWAYRYRVPREDAAQELALAELEGRSHVTTLFRIKRQSPRVVCAGSSTKAHTHLELDALDWDIIAQPQDDYEDTEQAACERLLNMIVAQIITQRDAELVWEISVLLRPIAEVARTRKISRDKVRTRYQTALMAMSAHYVS